MMMKMMKFSYSAIAALFILLLNGCVSVASSPASRFYMPISISKGEAKDKFEIPAGTIIVVGPIGIPDYQDRPQIVTTNKDSTLNFAQFDRWAEPLDSIFMRLLSDDMTAMLPSAAFHTFPCNFAIPLDYQVIVDIVQLDNQLDKQMALTAQWSIIDAKNRKMLVTKRSQFTQPIEPHNYSGVSMALSKVSISLSREIAQSLSTLPKATGK